MCQKSLSPFLSKKRHTFIHSFCSDLKFLTKKELNLSSTYCVFFLHCRRECRTSIWFAPHRIGHLLDYFLPHLPCTAAHQYLSTQEDKLDDDFNDFVQQCCAAKILSYQGYMTWKREIVYWSRKGIFLKRKKLWGNKKLLFPRLE